MTEPASLSQNQVKLMGIWLVRLEASIPRNDFRPNRVGCEYLPKNAESLLSPPEIEQQQCVITLVF